MAPEVAVLEGVDSVPDRPFELEYGGDPGQRRRRFGALAASTAVFKLNPACPARAAAYSCRVAEARVAEQSPFRVAVDAGLGENQVHNLPQGEFQGGCQLHVSTF